MGRMLEAIKQIEAKGPPPVSGAMRPTLRRRSGSAPAPAPWPEPVETAEWSPASEAFEPELLEPPEYAPPINAPAPFEPAHFEPVRRQPARFEPVYVEPEQCEPDAVVPQVAAPLMATPVADVQSQPHARRAAPSDQVRRVAAAMMAHVSALSSGVVALAAAEPRLETTAISAALAEALAAGPKYEVLLVDARLERLPGRLAEYWGGAPGLLDVLRRQTTWHETIRPTAVRGLSVLEAGTPGDQPSAEQWRILWSDLKRRFRFVLLDGGPAISMSTGWAPTVDAVYLMVELDCTARWAAEEAARHLQQCGARLAGTVLFDSQLRP